MTGWDRELAQGTLARIWESRIRPDLFAVATSSESPELITLGGAPASGKTRAGVHLERLSSECITRIVGDDFRVYHPQHNELLMAAPLEMPDVTAQAAGEWTRRSVEHALTQRYSCLVEGTWRNPEVALGTAARAVERGFRIHAVAVVVNPVLSRLATMERYYAAISEGKTARWTPPAIHDEVVAKFPDSARRIATSTHVAQVSVLDRGGDVVFTSTSSDFDERGAQFTAAVTEAQRRPLTGEESQRWVQQAETLHQLHLAHTREHPSAVAAWQRLMEVDRPLVEGYKAQGAVTTMFRSLPTPGPRGSTVRNNPSHLVAGRRASTGLER